MRVLIGTISYFLAHVGALWRAQVFFACAGNFRCARVLSSMQDILMRHDDDDDDDDKEDDNSVL